MQGHDYWMHSNRDCHLLIELGPGGRTPALGEGLGVAPGLLTSLDSVVPSELLAPTGHSLVFLSRHHKHKASPFKTIFLKVYRRGIRLPGRLSDLFRRQLW